MRKRTIAELMEDKRRLESESYTQRKEIELLERELKFFQTRELLMNTGIIALEKITDVIAHVVTDMKVLRDTSGGRR